MSAHAARLANAPARVPHGLCGYWLGEQSCGRPAAYLVALSECSCTIHGLACERHYACAEHTAAVRVEQRAVEITSVGVAA